MGIWKSIKSALGWETPRRNPKRRNRKPRHNPTLVVDRGASLIGGRHYATLEEARAGYGAVAADYARDKSVRVSIVGDDGAVIESKRGSRRGLVDGPPLDAFDRERVSSRAARIMRESASPRRNPEGKAARKYRMELHYSAGVHEEIRNKNPRAAVPHYEAALSIARELGMPTRVKLYTETLANARAAAARQNPSRRKTSAGLRAWRRKQKRGAIMRPSTFVEIESKARRAGYADPQAVAGRAYWTTAKAKYRKAQARKRRRRSASR